MVQKAIKKAGSIDLETVCRMLEAIVTERVKYTTPLKDKEEIADEVETRLSKAGIRSAKDVREIILGLERVA